MLLSLLQPLKCFTNVSQPRFTSEYQPQSLKWKSKHIRIRDSSKCWAIAPIIGSPPTPLKREWFFSLHPCLRKRLLGNWWLIPWWVWTNRKAQEALGIIIRRYWLLLRSRARFINLRDKYWLKFWMVLLFLPRNLVNYSDCHSDTWKQNFSPVLCPSLVIDLLREENLCTIF